MIKIDLKAFGLDFHTCCFGHGTGAGIKAEKLRRASTDRQSRMENQQGQGRRVNGLAVPANGLAKGAIPIRWRQLKNSLGQVMAPKPHSFPPGDLAASICVLQTDQQIFGLELVQEVERNRSVSSQKPVGSCSPTSLDQERQEETPVKIRTH